MTTEEKKEWLEYCREKLYKLPENTWFAPTNRQGNDFDICAQLFEHGYIKRRIIDVPYNYAVKGTRHEFFYTKPI